MSRKPRYQYLLNKSIQAVISAIEIYNKPDFKYREESFSILMVNAWEILLKAKIVCDNSNELKSIYTIDKDAKKKDGQPFKRPKYKLNRAGNYLTINIFNCLNKLELNSRLIENIKLLAEIRDNAIHFFNDNKLFKKKVLEIGTATLKSYVYCVKNWFNYNLSQYNFYLMPISFFHTYEVQSFSINKEDKQYQNLLQYIASKEAKFPSDINKEHNISLILQTKFVRSKSTESTSVRRDDNNPNAIPIKVSVEEQFAKKFKWTYRDDLIPKLKQKCKNIVLGKEFRSLMKELEKDENLCGKRYLDFRKNKGVTKKFYNPDILKEICRYYKNKKP
ncbi:MAG: DUF3644 domain-containing protein [Tenacibaculum sp.]